MEPEPEQSEVQTAQPVSSRRDRLFRYHAATAGVILLVAVILHTGEADHARVHGCGTFHSSLPSLLPSHSLSLQKEVALVS